MSPTTRGPLHSLLFDTPEPPDVSAPPPWADALVDLHLEDIITAATPPRGEYDLQQVYRRPLHNLDAIAYRHSVFHELERDEVHETLAAFVTGIRDVHRRLETRDKLYSPLEANLWHLSAVLHYDTVLADAEADLQDEQPASRALRTMREDLSSYLDSAGFRAMDEAARSLRHDLDNLRYVVLSQGNKLTVGPYDDEADYTVQVLDTFERFRESQPSPPQDERTSNKRRRRSTKQTHDDPLGRVDAIILSLVAEVFPTVFDELQEFCSRYHDFVTEQILGYERDAQFYLSYIRLMSGMTQRGIRFTLPRLSLSERTERVEGMIDMALAHRRTINPVPNDYRIDPGESMLAISGPNQGGKTTTARAIGQLHYLAAIGVPVAAEHAQLMLADRVFTHFERSESIETLAGKLEDELQRIREILHSATRGSFIILNETFGSTSLDDGRLLGTAVIKQILRIGSPSVYVTFIDELTAIDPSIVSMKSLVDPNDVTVRTFKVERHPADGRASALALARKHGLDYDSIREEVTA